MKTFRLIAAGLFFAALFSVSSFAQTGASAAGTGKIVIINTAAFDDKAVPLERRRRASRSSSGCQRAVSPYLLL